MDPEAEMAAMSRVEQGTKIEKVSRLPQTSDFQADEHRVLQLLEWDISDSKLVVSLLNAISNPGTATSGIRRR